MRTVERIIHLHSELHSIAVFEGNVLENPYVANVNAGTRQDVAPGIPKGSRSGRGKGCGIEIFLDPLALVSLVDIQGLTSVIGAFSTEICA